MLKTFIDSPVRTTAPLRGTLARTTFVMGGLCGLFCLGFSGKAAADDVPTPQPAAGWSFGLFGGEAANHNLTEMLPKALSGDFEFKSAHLGGLIVRRELPTPGWLQRFGAWASTPVGNSVEIGLYKASGLADNSELTIDWRPAIRPGQIGPITLEFAWGLGYSHSFGKPWTDYTDPNRPGGYRNLFHMTPEIAFIPTAAPNWSLALRVHHRSGIYGVAAPRRAGSNHLALVLTHAF